MDSSAYHRASKRYENRRRIAFERVQRLAIRIGAADASLRFTDIDDRALNAWQSTWPGSSFQRHGGWNWLQISKPYRRRPTAFHVAVWRGNQLCGMAVGRLSKRRSNGLRHTLSLHYMEANPNPEHPLRGRVAPLVFAAAEEYARGFGAARLRLIEPLPAVLGLYARLGFSVVVERGRPLYCEKEIEYGYPSF